MISIRAAISLLAGGLLLAACGSGGNGEGDKRADQIFADAVAALSAAKSVHIDARQPGSGGSSASLAFTVDVESGQGAVGVVSVKGSPGQFVFAGGTLYARGREFFASLVGAQAAAVIGDRWVSLPSSVSSSGFAAYADTAKLARCISLDHGTLSKGGTATVDGQAAIVLIDAGDKPGTAPARLDVAATGTPYPLELQLTGNTKAGASPGGAACGGSSAGSDNATGTVVKFTGYNQSHPAATPPAGAVSLESLFSGH